MTNDVLNMTTKTRCLLLICTVACFLMSVNMLLQYNRSGSPEYQVTPAQGNSDCARAPGETIFRQEQASNHPPSAAHRGAPAGQSGHVEGLSQESMQAWCPNAQCQVTDLCHPCKRRYLILIAMRRSGSTTLQQMLDSLPGVRLSGENNGMLTNFQLALDDTLERREWQKGANGPLSAWNHYAYPSAAFACVVQQMIETISPPPNVNGVLNQTHSFADYSNDMQQQQRDSDTIVGFKTIRFPADTYKQNQTTNEHWSKFLNKTALFLNRMLPCAKIVINIRSNQTAHAKAVRHFMARGQNLDDLIEASNQRRQELLQFAQFLNASSSPSSSSRVHVLDSTQWTQNVSLINDLVSWLGFATPACHFDELFQYNTRGGYGRGQVGHRTNPERCTALPA